MYGHIAAQETYKGAIFMIILASASPRRRELLKLIFDEFEVVPADIDETVRRSIEIEEYPEYLAIKKARHIAEKRPIDDIVIGCDTGVFIDGMMLGKPESREQAFEMLKLLSGRTHKVITGCSIFYKGQNISFSEETQVEFYRLSDTDINEYIITGEPMDKAGAYGIQGKGALLVKRIVGDYYNVVGLPVGMIKQNMKKMMKF